MNIKLDIIAHKLYQIVYYICAKDINEEYEIKNMGIFVRCG